MQAQRAATRRLVASESMKFTFADLPDDDLFAEVVRTLVDDVEEIEPFVVSVESHVFDFVDTTLSPSEFRAWKLRSAGTALARWGIELPQDSRQWSIATIVSLIRDEERIRRRPPS